MARNAENCISRQQGEWCCHGGVCQALYVRLSYRYIYRYFLGIAAVTLFSNLWAFHLDPMKCSDITRFLPGALWRSGSAFGHSFIFWLAIIVFSFFQGGWWKDLNRSLPSSETLRCGRQPCKMNYDNNKVEDAAMEQAAKVSCGKEIINLNFIVNI